MKCNEDDTIGDLKKLVAAQTGRLRRLHWINFTKEFDSIFVAVVGLHCRHEAGENKDSKVVYSVQGSYHSCGLRNSRRHGIGTVLQLIN